MDWVTVVRYAYEIFVFLYPYVKEYVIKKIEDDAGRKIIQFVQQIDYDGDNVIDEEIIIHSIEAMIPDLDSQFNLVSDGDTVGLGMPLYEVIDGRSLVNYIDFTEPYNMPQLTGNGDGWLVDLDHDGQSDDVLIPLPDFNADGANEWGWIVDQDDNGLPDVSPNSPYYPVGSEEYFEILNISDDGIMHKELDDYTVSEGLLLLLVIFGFVSFFKGLFKKREVF